MTSGALVIHLVEFQLFLKDISLEVASFLVRCEIQYGVVVVAFEIGEKVLKTKRRLDTLHLTTEFCSHDYLTHLVYRRASHSTGIWSAIMK